MHTIQPNITSKNTSINSKKLPAIYSKLNWDALMSQWVREHNGENPIGIILDYGCGRYIQHIQDFVNSKGFYYIGYDPYWNNIDFMLEKDGVMGPEAYLRWDGTPQKIRDTKFTKRNINWITHNAKLMKKKELEAILKTTYYVS